MKSPYDLLIVGAGISAATLCARLKDRLRICVLDVRPHLGGNCYDYKAAGSFVHKYGPHIFHSSSPAVVTFLSNYTEWTPFHFSIQAEIEEANEFRIVPFPYCKATSRVLGRELTPDEILAKFFHGYSKKMWGMDWDELPGVIKGRVPKETGEEPNYFPGQFVAMPKKGYSHMIENMFDDVDVLLDTGPQEWHAIPAKNVVYCGRPDLILPPGPRMGNYGERYNLQLDFRSLDIHFSIEDWYQDAPILNYCSDRRKYTRKTCYAKLTGGQSQVVSYEIPYQAHDRDLLPYYPIPTDNNLSKAAVLKQKIREDYPNLYLCGRLGTYKYLDMFQAVAQGLALADKLIGGGT